MPTEFKFPDVGEGISEGVIVKWLVEEGDTIKEDQNVAEVETDKAVVELPAPAGGKVLSINFEQGETVKVGEVLMTIGSDEEQKEKPDGKKSPKKKADKEKTEKEKPDRESEEKQKKKFDKKKEKTEKEPDKPDKIRQKKKPDKREEKGKERILAAPATRKLARELDINLSSVDGSGPAGRITRDDVETAVKGQKRKEDKKEAETGKPESSKLSLEVSGDEERVRLSGIRKTIAERLSYSWRNIPQACGMDYADVTKLVDVRQREKEVFEKRDIKLTFLPFILKACAIALRKYPQFNANFDEEKMEIIFKRKLNIGIAVDTDEGLMVPVIKDIERKSVGEIAKEIEELAESARNRKISPKQMEGGTFSLTNIGSIGGMYSFPIVNPPEIAIIGVHRIKDLPLVLDGKIVPRKVLGLSLSFDHRVVDGAAATRFMNTIIKHLEDPNLLLVDMR
jgi:pyruvate dehydrogenase E2 component (dihydrolipoamide acetyltransferase)